jgi:DNA-binding Lrp family transcriptional regulator
MKSETYKLTKNEKEFVKCILENGNLTDSKISKIVGISNSTCSRIRKKLEKNFISEYIPIIELHKVGINVFLVCTFQWNALNKPLLTKKVFSKIKSDPHVVFFANGEGSAANTVLFMAFQNLDNCYAYLKKFREENGKHIQNINTLFLPSKEIIKNDFTDIIKEMLKGEK